MKTTDIKTDECAGYFFNYISLVSNEYSLIEELEISVHRLIKFVQDIPLDKFDFCYAEGKWKIKDILQHLIDTERILSYRALRFARNDNTSLPGFDENLFAQVSNSNERSIMELLTEFAIVRQATISLFKSFSNTDLFKIGVASDNPISVRALGFVIIGHQNHHQRVFQEKYIDSIS